MGDNIPASKQISTESDLHKHCMAQRRRQDIKMKQTYICVVGLLNVSLLGNMTIQVDEAKKVEAEWRRETAQHPLNTRQMAG